MHKHRPRRIHRGVIGSDYEQCQAGCKYEPGTCYEHIASAIATELGIREEFQVRTDGADFGRHLDRLGAEEEFDHRKAIEARTPDPTSWDSNPRIIRRLVADWALDGGGQ